MLNSKNLSDEITRMYTGLHDASHLRVVSQDRTDSTPFDDQTIPQGAAGDWPEPEDAAPPGVDPLLTDGGRRWLSELGYLTWWVTIMAGMFVAMDLIERMYR